jgi:hypothetical protein
VSQAPICAHGGTGSGSGPRDHFGSGRYRPLSRCFTDRQGIMDLANALGGPELGRPLPTRGRLDTAQSLRTHGQPSADDEAQGETRK